MRPKRDALSFRLMGSMRVGLGCSQASAKEALSPKEEPPHLRDGGCKGWRTGRGTRLDAAGCWTQAPGRGQAKASGKTPDADPP